MYDYIFLREAFMQRDFERAKSILAEIINTYSKSDVFTSACYYCHLDLAKWLIEMNPDTNVHEYNESALHCACMAVGGTCNQALELVQWLVTRFPDINVHTAVAFYTACYYGQLETAQWLLAKFPSINVVEENVLEFVCIAFNPGYNSRICHGVQHLTVCWLLTFYTADQFWATDVQKWCHNVLANWREEVEPRRRWFMHQIAPHLLAQ